MHLIFRLYINFIYWVKNRFSKKMFLILSSIIVGFTAGIVAVILKLTVFNLHRFFYLTSKIYSQNYLYIVLPIIGIVLTILVKKYFLNNFKKGTGQILSAIAKKSSLIEKETTYSHLLTSAITIGLGGSAGLEAPIVISGAAIGSNLSRVNRMDYNERTLLLACGSAAGIAAVFNAPIAGIMLALEIILADVSLHMIVPLIISAVTGALCSKIILQEGLLLSFTLKQPFNFYNIPYYLVLGLLAGAVSVYYAEISLKIEKYSRRFDKNIYRKTIIGGIFLGLLIFLFPPIFGEGYSSILQLANGNSAKLLENSLFYNLKENEWFILLFITSIALLKVIATSLTLNFGGNGGNFAPSLFVGAFLGFSFSKLINLLNITNVPESNFTIVGMAGILSGVMYAPLTGIFLIAEVTGGYELMIPLMIVATISYGIAKNFHPYSMETRELAELGHILTEDKDKNILTLLDIKEIIETDFTKIYSYQKIQDLSDIITHSNRNLFPVVDKNNKLMGIVYLENIREIMFELPSLNELHVIELMSNPPELIQFKEDMNSVMKKFDECNAWNLPVVNNGEYIGFISKSRILANYRSRLIK
jgi:chloride channel protein, CIC family